LVRIVETQGLACCDAADAVDEVTAANLLEDVTGGPRHDRVEQRLVVGERGEHEHGHLGVLRTDVAAGLDPGAIRQPHVHDDDLRPVGAGTQHGLVGVAGLGDDLEALLRLEQRAQRAIVNTCGSVAHVSSATSSTSYPSASVR
jgi:hypothetical protein